MRLRTIVIIVIGLTAAVAIGYFLGAFPLANFVMLLEVAGVLVAIYRPRLGLYVMFLLIPLQNLVTLASGATLVRVVGIVVFLAWVLNRLFQRKPLRTLFAKPILLPMLAFFVLAFISAFWSKTSLWQQTLFTYIQLGAWAIMLMDLVDSFEYLEHAMLWVFVGSLVGALLSVYEFNTQVAGWQFGQRGRGGFDDPNYSSAMFMFIMPYVFHRIRYDRGLQKLVWVAGAMILLTGVAYTVSRTGLLSILILLAGQFVIFSKTQSRLKYVLLVVILLLITSPLWPWENIFYRFSIAWTGGQQQDLGERVGNLQLGWKIFSRYPLRGQGLGYPPGQDVIHNTFLGIATQIGILGFALMFWMWLTTWRSLTKAQKQAAAFAEERQFNLISTLQLTALVYLFFSFSLATEVSRPLWLLFALGGICYSIVREKQKAQEPKRSPVQLSPARRPLS